MKAFAKCFAILCVLTVVGTAAAQSGGADVYSGKCAMCHGAKGLGDTPAGKMLQVPSLKSAAIVKASNGELFAAVKNGKGKMPAENGKLTDEQIRAVIAYVRTLQR